MLMKSPAVSYYITHTQHHSRTADMMRLLGESSGAIPPAVALLQDGDYVGTLAAGLPDTVFGPVGSAGWDATVVAQLSAHVQSADAVGQHGILAAGVAALYLYLQANAVGPLQSMAALELGVGTQRWACDQLACDGEVVCQRKGELGGTRRRGHLQRKRHCPAIYQTR